MTEPTALDQALQHLRNATQALWDARQKGHCSYKEAVFLEPLQAATQELLNQIEDARKFLRERQP